MSIPPNCHRLTLTSPTVYKLHIHMYLKSRKAWENSHTLPFHFQSVKKVHCPNHKEKYISTVVRIRSIIIFHLNKLWKSEFSILCDANFLVWLQGKFDIDPSCCSCTRECSYLPDQMSHEEQSTSQICRTSPAHGRPSLDSLGASWPWQASWHCFIHYPYFGPCRYD